MTRTNTPDEDRRAAERAASRPERAAERLDTANLGENVAPAMLGAELAAERRPREESETAQALERATRGRGRDAREVEP
jgi:hypothetical protein